MVKELRDLAAPAALPLSPAATVFVRCDPDRTDRVRALLTGPEGTPYFGGLFAFDALFPAAYPDVPPVLLLDTTGGGRARFNPNLYADGKAGQRGGGGEVGGRVACEAGAGGRRACAPRPPAAARPFFPFPFFQVCLSLLGTWHGTDDSEKWSPDA